MTLRELFSRLLPDMTHRVTLEDSRYSSYNLFLDFTTPDADFQTFKRYADLEVLEWYVSHDGRIIVKLNIERF